MVGAVQHGGGIPHEYLTGIGGSIGGSSSAILVVLRLIIQFLYELLDKFKTLTKRQRICHPQKFQFGKILKKSDGFIILLPLVVAMVAKDAIC